MKVVQTLSFKKSVKKLHTNQKHQLDAAVRCIMATPLIGQQKKGELAEVRVYKFKIESLLMLLAYCWESESDTLTLLQLGSHENFYRDLKRM